jgi:phosphate transport system substrate-binding protein
VNIKTIFLWVAVPLLAVSCSKDDGKLKSGVKRTTPNSGQVTILIDESLSPAILPEVDIFEHLNPDADIIVKVVKESDGVRQLLIGRDTSPLLFIGRKLKEDELKPLTQRSITPHYSYVARDAIAVLAHPSRKDVKITFQQIKDVLAGKINTWGALLGTQSKDPINLVYDEQGSGVVQYALDLNNAGTLPSNAYAVKGTAAAIEYVNKNKNGLVLIGWSYMSDSDNQQALAWRKQVEVVQISPRDTLQGKEYFFPYPTDVGLELYPLVREITSVNIEGYDGLATGFVNFIATDRGQRILLKAGLVPANVPARLIEFKASPKIHISPD